MVAFSRQASVASSISSPRSASGAQVSTSAAMARPSGADWIPCARRATRTCPRPVLSAWSRSWRRSLHRRRRRCRPWPCRRGDSDRRSIRRPCPWPCRWDSGRNRRRPNRLRRPRRPSRDWILPPCRRRRRPTSLRRRPRRCCSSTTRPRSARPSTKATRISARRPPPASA